MTRLDEVARLKALEAEATPGKWYKGEMDEGDCDEINGRMQGWETGMIYDRELGVFHPTEIKRRVSESEWIDDARLVTVCSPEQESDADLIANLRNAAPWLLEALACFQPGDAERILTVLWALNDPMWASCVEVLTRLQKAAEIMEGQEC